MLSHRSKMSLITLRHAFLLTVTGWFVAAIFCALPLAMSDLDLHYTDAFFEATSGITTTGATIIPDIQQASDGVLIWRSMMQWFGGLGSVAFAIILLPYLKVGGMQIFKLESSSGSQKVLPRSSDIITSLVKVYILLSALCMAVYFALGMDGFDAINHAMTTISTGGFSTHNTSIGRFDNIGIEYAAIFFMVLGALPFVLYIRMFYHKRFLFLNDEQVIALTQGICGFVTVMTLWLAVNSDYSVEESFRYVLFHTVSVMTTTGFTTMEYTSWGGFAVLAFLLSGRRATFPRTWRVLYFLLLLAQVVLLCWQPWLWLNGESVSGIGLALVVADIVALIWLLTNRRLRACFNEVKE